MTSKTTAPANTAPPGRREARAHRERPHTQQAEPMNGDQEPAPAHPRLPKRDCGHGGEAIVHGGHLVKPEHAEMAARCFRSPRPEHHGRPTADSPADASSCREPRDGSSSASRKYSCRRVGAGDDVPRRFAKLSARRRREPADDVRAGRSSPDRCRLPGAELHTLGNRAPGSVVRSSSAAARAGMTMAAAPRESAELTGGGAGVGGESGRTTVPSVRA